MFNQFIWGGYLLYRLYPRYQVFIDGQTDFYGEELTREYGQVVTLSPQWDKVLDRYGVSWVIIPVDAPLAVHLAALKDWRLLYQDQVASVFVRVERN